MLLVNMPIVRLVTGCLWQFLHLFLHLFRGPRSRESWSSMYYMMSSWRQYRCAIPLLREHAILTRESWLVHGWIWSPALACVLFPLLLCGGAAPRVAVLLRAPCAQPLVVAGELRPLVRRGPLWCLSTWDRESGAGCVLSGKEFGSMS